MSLRFTVGVTGHRLNQLAEADRGRIATEIARTIDQIAAAATEAAGTVAFTLASAIAEGADRYAADAALQLGWRLVCPLPFEIPRYEQDFGDPASVAAFQSYLKRAAWVRPADPASVEALDFAGGAAPYAAVGHMLVAEADVMIAVWNGQPPKGPGGTAEVGALALMAGKPVIWISTTDARAARLILPEKLPRRGSKLRKVVDGLAQRFDTLPRPDALCVAG
jgi:hypothetical protein